MPCYKPLHGYVSKAGGFKVVFDPDTSYGERMAVPCGRCIGCRLARAKDWGVRCSHEAQICEEEGTGTCFITLTYDDKYLPGYGSLVKADFQKFMKKFRKKHPGRKIRYYQCGEYGEKLLRPHYHACIFGYGFEDRKLLRRAGKGKEALYRSSELEELWDKGYSSVGNLTWESAAYTARYILKKINGEQAEEHYTAPDIRTGEIDTVIPEYTTMSRGRRSEDDEKDDGGIGYRWIKRYLYDVYPHDFVVGSFGKSRPPRYYDNNLSMENPDLYEKIKEKRRERAIVQAEDNTAERLAVREEVQMLKAQKLTREYELGDHEL